MKIFIHFPSLVFSLFLSLSPSLLQLESDILSLFLSHFSAGKTETDVDADANVVADANVNADENARRTRRRRHLGRFAMSLLLPLLLLRLSMLAQIVCHAVQILRDVALLCGIMRDLFPTNNLGASFCH